MSLFLSVNLSSNEQVIRSFFYDRTDVSPFAPTSIGLYRIIYDFYIYIYILLLERILSYMFAYDSCFSNSSQRPPEISVTVTTVPSASILSPGRKSVHAFAPASPCFDFVKKKKFNRYRAFGSRRFGRPGCRWTRDFRGAPRKPHIPLSATHGQCPDVPDFRYRIRLWRI